MRFDISRQPLVPAFLTLFVLAAAAVWSMGAPADGFLAELRITPAELLHPGNGVYTHPAASGTETLAVPLPGVLLDRFQAAHPAWSRFLAGFLLLFTGMCLGRLTVRYNLYAVGTCVAIPLYAAAACGLSPGEHYLTAYAASALFILAIKNFSRSFCNGYAFDALFRGSLYLGILLTLLPAAIPLILMLPLSIVLFRRTLREASVALFGLLLAPLLIGYVNWGAGGDFIAPFIEFASALTDPNPLDLVLHTPLPTLVLLGGILLLDVFAVMLFLSDIYFVGTKARTVLFYGTGMLLLSAVMLFCPDPTPAVFALVAVPSAILIPVFFVRTHRSVVLPLYLLLLAAAVAGIALQ